jgi:hypothetical protein
MSEKCKYCKERIFDNDGQSYGTILSDGNWVCYDDGCMADCIQELDKSRARLKAVETKVKALLHKWQNEGCYINGDAYEICQQELAAALATEG